MGQVASISSRGESPSIKKLRQLLSDLQNYVKLLKNLGEDLPSSKQLMNVMSEPLDKFASKLRSLRVELKKDGEICRELHDTIIEIEGELKENKVVTKYSVFIRRLRSWERMRGDIEEEVDLDDLRREVREYILDFSQRLKEAFDNRCYPDLE
jgi:chromosome segregation ATPase